MNAQRINAATQVRRNLPNPLPVTTDLLTQRRFEVLLTSATLTFTVSPKALIDVLPGGSALWDKVQFHTFDIFSDVEVGGVYTPIAATLETPSSGYFGDHPTGFSDGVGAFRRAHVGFTPNELFRTTWIDSSDTSPLLTITAASTSGTNTQCILQFVAVLRSTATGVTGDHAEVVSPAGHERVNSQRRITLCVTSPMTTFREVFDESE